MIAKDVKFADNNEVDAIKLLTKYVLSDHFYDELSDKNTPENRQYVQLLISYMKRDTWTLDDNEIEAGERALNFYCTSYITNHLSKKEVAEDILAKFYADGGKTRLFKIAKDKLGVDVKSAIVKRKKRTITKKDITSGKPSGFDYSKYYSLFDYPDKLDFNDEAFDIISREIYSGRDWYALDFFSAYDSENFKDYDKWFYLSRHTLMTTNNFKLFFLAGDILNIIWLAIDPDDEDTSAWLKDQIFDIFWSRVGDIKLLLDKKELDNYGGDEGLILEESIKWLKCLDGIKERLPGLPDDFEYLGTDEHIYKKAFKNDMKELRQIIKKEGVSIDKIAALLQRTSYDSWDKKDAIKFEKYVTENIIPEIKDKKFLAFLKKLIQRVHHNADTVEIESKNIAKIRGHLKNWPEYVSSWENPEFLGEIKLEHIVTAEIEREDKFYDHVFSDWYMTLQLKVNGKDCRAFISDQRLYRKYNGMICESGKFNCEPDDELSPPAKMIYTRKRNK